MGDYRPDGPFIEILERDALKLVEGLAPQRVDDALARSGHVVRLESLGHVRDHVDGDEYADDDAQPLYIVPQSSIGEDVPVNRITYKNRADDGCDGEHDN